MRRVHKGPEPESLTTYRNTTVDPTWDGYKAKDDAHEVSAREQRQICAFCQVSVKYRAKPWKLAHIVPRNAQQAAGLEDGAQLQLSWNNIVCVCPGGENTKRPRIMHCDSLQANTRLLPALDPVQFQNGSLTFDWDGRIKSADPAVQVQIEDVLGLNRRPVVAGRNAALEEVMHDMEGLASHDEREEQRQSLLRLLDPAKHSTAPLREYADYLLFHLREGVLAP